MACNVRPDRLGPAFRVLPGRFDSECQARRISLATTPPKSSSRPGELLRDQAERGERATKDDNLKQGPKSRDKTSGPTLADIGISRDQSSKRQNRRTSAATITNLGALVPGVNLANQCH